jgi:hypothetical protein
MLQNREESIKETENKKTENKENEKLPCPRCKKLIKTQSLRFVRFYDKDLNIIKLDVCKMCLLSIELDVISGKVPNFYEEYKREHTCSIR